MKKNNTEKRKPFFAEFLENQMGEEQARNTQGGDGPYVTLKYPSDEEDNPQTKKYPSDQEDNPTPTKPALDLYQTMKYPSDNDESGTQI